MSDFNLKRDLKRGFNKFLAVLSVLVLFVVFALAIIVPIYYFSQYSIRWYTIATLGLAALLLAYVLARKVYTISCKYRGLLPLVLHIIFKFFLPLGLALYSVIYEAFFFNFFLNQYRSMALAVIVVTLATVVLIAKLAIIHRIYAYTVKRYLLKHEIKS